MQIGCQRSCHLCRAIFDVQLPAQPQRPKYWDFVRVTRWRTVSLNFCKTRCCHKPVAGREARGKITPLLLEILVEMAAGWTPTGKARLALLSISGW